jgi:hypothetical protein
MLQISGHQLRAGRHLLGQPSLRAVAAAVGIAPATLQRLEVAQCPALTAHGETLGRLVCFYENAGLRFATHDGTVVVALQPAQRPDVGTFQPERMHP